MLSSQELDVIFFSILVYSLRSKGKVGHSAAAQIVGVGIASENRIAILGFVSRYVSRNTAKLYNRCTRGWGIFSKLSIFNIMWQLNVLLA